MNRKIEFGHYCRRKGNGFKFPSYNKSVHTGKATEDHHVPVYTAGALKFLYGLSVVSGSVIPFKPTIIIH